MIIREITVKDLPGFIDSALYRESEIKPITPERVLSQLNNPRALPDDVVLIVAYTENGRLAGFAGMLPDRGINGHGSYRFAWNSGWWIDPEAGRSIALNLLYRSVKAWKGYYLITDLIPHTRRIIELTRLFLFANYPAGQHMQLLSDFAGKLTRSYRPLMLFSGLLKLTDILTNTMLRYRLTRWKRKKHITDLVIEYVKHPDDDCLKFIERQNQFELCQRGRAELDWIISYPWLIKPEPGMVSMKYPFSRECVHFEYIMARILYRGDLSGLVLLTNRDGLFKIPYAYYNPSVTTLISNAVCHMLIDKKATGFCTFRKELLDYMMNNRFPRMYKKSIVKDLAINKAIAEKHPENYRLQDGDGDVVFT